MKHIFPPSARQLHQLYLNACRKDDKPDILMYMNELLARQSDFFSHDAIKGKLEQGLHTACVNDCLESVKYLMTSPELPYRCCSRKAFEIACAHERWPIIEFMIMDYKMGKSAAVEEAIIEIGSNDNRQRVEKLFELRSLNTQLHALTQHPTQVLSRPKI